MYEEFFGLQRRPFSATPNPNRFVPLETHQGVLDALAVSCERGQGIGVLTGEAGLGKSMVGLRLAFELQPTFATAFLGHSAYATRRALLQAILFELNRPYDRMGEQELRLELTSALKSLRSEKQGLVLIVDETHRLSVPLLDEVRLLTLLAYEGEPLVRAVLIGNREFEERLADPEFAAFNQRVACQVDLAPLTQVESLEYLSTSLELAGAEAEEIFTEEALAFLAKAADGVPRCLNHLADHSLLLAFVTERRPVSADVVRQALDDLKQLPLQWNDPISGGEIYRGLSQRPAMEDSAVDLWPQHMETTVDEPQPSRSWEESAFGESSAAIEIGGELDAASDEPHESEPVSTEQFSCLKPGWQENARQSSVDELLNDVAELAQSLETDAVSPLRGQTFAGRDIEFGAQSPHSFAVEEFADGSEFGDKSPADPWSLAGSDDVQPVWNLPERPCSLGDDADADVEEEPVIDRYVRIENDTNDAVTNWNRHAAHSRSTANRAVAPVKTTPVLMAAADEPTDLPPSKPEGGRDLDLGIVESYSRNPRNVGPVSNEARDEVKLDWHLPTELLKVTLEDDGVEEQMSADVLDMYLDVKQSLVDRQIAKDASANSEAEDLPQDLGRDDRSDRVADSSADKPDVIQRAYSRLFSELRRRRK